MKKALAIVMAAIAVVGFAACGKTEPPAADATTADAAVIETTAAETTAADETTAVEETTANETTASENQDAQRRLIINSEPFVVTAKDGFDNAGVTALVCDASATYSFKASNADTTWKVFVLDEEFTDGARYLAQAQTPVLEGDGTLTIDEGKFIYVLCSESAFSADAPTDATLTINYAE